MTRNEKILREAIIQIMKADLGRNVPRGEDSYFRAIRRICVEATWATEPPEWKGIIRTEKEKPVDSNPASKGEDNG